VSMKPRGRNEMLERDMAIVIEWSRANGHRGLLTDGEIGIWAAAAMFI
jgi:hypothetical protein